jgi:hypothetical protein
VPALEKLTKEGQKMDRVDLGRIIFGLTVALWLPASLPGLKSNLAFRVLWPTLYALYTLAPFLGELQSWVIWIATIAASVAIHAATEEKMKIQFPQLKNAMTQAWSAGTRRSAVVVSWCAVTMILLLTFSDLAASIRSIPANSKLSLIISGLLLASFCGNDVARLIVERFVKIPSQDSAPSRQAVLVGAHIGWIERAIVFALVAGGQPSAAALAVTAKSLARVADPATQEEGFVEYFLIGTLTSLLVALSVAVLTRLTLGYGAF